MKDRGLPYPGHLTQQDRTNLESVRYKPAIHFEYFTYGIPEVNKSKIIFQLPRGAMIYGSFSFRTTEPFGNTEGPSANTEIRIGTDLRSDSFLTVSVQSRGSYIVTPPGDAGVSFRIGLTHLQVAPEITNVRILLTPITPGIPPTMGKGWGIIPWLDMNQVEGY